MNFLIENFNLFQSIPQFNSIIVLNFFSKLKLINFNAKSIKFNPVLIMIFIKIQNIFIENFVYCRFTIKTKD